MSQSHPLQIRAEAPALLDALTLADLWNRAQGDGLPTSGRLLAWALEAQPPRRLGAWVAAQADQPVGFALASHLGDGAMGWVDALAVPARANRAAIRTALLAHAAAWLKLGGCAALQMGGGPRSLLRGVPPERGRTDFYVRRGFVEVGSLADLRADVARYAPPDDAPVFAGVVRPPHPRDRDDVDALLANPAALTLAALGAPADFAALLPVIDTLRDGRLADMMLLWSSRGLEGLSLLVFADSATPLDVAYPYSLPRPWAALGPVVVRADAAAGAAGMLLDASLRRLHNNGANSCVAWGVRERARYAAYGFGPLRTWGMLVKGL